MKSQESYPETREGFIALIDFAFGADLVQRVAAAGTVTPEEIQAEIDAWNRRKYAQKHRG